MGKIMCFLALAAALMLLAGCLTTEKVDQQNQRCLIAVEFTDYGYLYVMEGSYSSIDGENISVIPDKKATFTDKTEFGPLKMKASKENGPLPFSQYSSPSSPAFNVEVEYMVGQLTTSAGSKISVKVFPFGEKGENLSSLDGSYNYEIFNVDEYFFGCAVIKSDQFFFDDQWSMTLGEVTVANLRVLKMIDRDGLQYYLFYDPATSQMFGYIADTKTQNVGYLMQMERP